MSAPAPPVPTHLPCCSAHNVPMSCEQYRRTHFVEVRPCCAVDAAVMKAAYEAGEWCGECFYEVVMDPPCCTPARAS